MSDREAHAKARLATRCALALDGDSRTSPRRSAFFVPGRIEILGKHTDYAGGRSLLCTVERGFVVAVAPRDDAIVCVTDALRGETRELSLDPEGPKERPGDWSTYVATVTRRVARNFPRARRGADIAFASDLPPASGMSSSSALVTGIFLALDAANGLSASPEYRSAIGSPESLAGYLAAVENGQGFGALGGDVGVGTFGGSEDHTAILCCRSGMLSRYAFSPVRAEGTIAFPADRTFVVAYSGIAAEKASRTLERYNEASLAVSRILRLWNQAESRTDRSLADAVTSMPGAADRIRALLRDSTGDDFRARRLLDRFEQFVTETYDIVPRAADAWIAGDFGALGTVVDRSQRAAESLLGNQIPETIALASLARRNGAGAASAFGAGFGGSVWALVAAADADRFGMLWRDRYAEAFPNAARHAEFIVTRPGPGAMRLW